MTILSCDKIQETEVVCIRSYVVVPFSNSGYMAPVYDVFRFGKRIVDFIHPNMVQASFLMYVTLFLSFWKIISNDRFPKLCLRLVWSEGEALALMGPVLKQSWVHAGLLKFIRIGLLCVQDRRLSRQAHHVFCGYYVSKRFGTTSSTNPTCSFCWPNCRKAGSILTRCRNLLC